jgi:exonuclease SbcD
MRILHTADWHLADRLGRIDRTDDLRRAVERVAAYCQSERIDVLLVAGDLFSELAGAEALRDTIRHLQETFEPFLREGGTILTLTGNHDRENFCQTLRAAMSLAAPSAEQPGALVPHGRFYLATEPDLVRVEDRHTGLPVQFLLMPYPTPTRYLRGEANQRYQGYDERNRALMTAFTRTLHDLRNSDAFSEELPAILSAHIGVRGSDLGRLFRLSEDEDVIFDPAEIPTGFAYTALGHIHRPQAVGGNPAVRYSGSIERMDLGEQNDDKSVVVFDLGAEGIEGEIRTLPLESTPVYEINITDPTAELPELRERFPQADNHLVRIRSTYTACVEVREEVLRELDALFPRWYDRQISEASPLGGTLSLGGPSKARTFEQTVRDYVDQELTNHSDAERAAILAELESLLQEVQA